MCPTFSFSLLWNLKNIWASLFLALEITPKTNKHLQGAETGSLESYNISSSHQLFLFAIRIFLLCDYKALLGNICDGIFYIYPASLMVKSIGEDTLELRAVFLNGFPLQFWLLFL